MKSATDVVRAPSVGTLGLTPYGMARKSPTNLRCGTPPQRTPLPQRWNRARKWFDVRGIGSPDMAALKLMLEAENVGAG